MHIRKNNKGITLVELIISMAIAAIVFSIIAIMINTAAKGFQRSNEDVNLQMEAQITINQLSTLVMEVKDKDSIKGPYIGIDPQDVKYLIRTSVWYSLYFDYDKNKLYLATENTDSETDANSINPIASQTTEYQYLMAEHVTSISIDNTDLKTANIVIEFGLGDQSYTTSKKVKLRNVK